MIYFYLGRESLLNKLVDNFGYPSIFFSNFIGAQSSVGFEVFNSKDCKSGEYSVADWKTIPPLSREQIIHFSEVEQIYLKMADRLGIIQPYQQRKDEYIKHLRFWLWKLEKYKFDFAIFENIPHEGYNFIIYSIFKTRDIRVLSFYQLPIRPNKTYLLQAVFDIFDHGSEIKNILNSNLDEGCYSLTDEQKDKFKGYLDIINYQPNEIQSFTRENKNVGPNFTKLKKIVYLTVKKMDNLRRRSNSDIRRLISIYLGLEPYFFSRKKYLQYYNRKSVTPDLSKPYIYFLLHYQPELSTSPLGGVFVDQILACEIIAYVANTIGISVYIKEHPRISKAHGTRAFNMYDRLIEYDNVKIINNEINTYSLIDQSECVATITGSSGLEALLRKKPVLMFGNRFYEAFSGVFTVSSVGEATKALNDIVNNKINIKDSDIYKFLYALDKVTIQAFNSEKDKDIATVSLDQSDTNKIDMIRRYFY